MRRVLSLLCLLPIGLGCRTSLPGASAVPNRHVVRANQMVIRSDVELDREHPRVTELSELGRDIQSRLDLPEQHHEVSVYLFKTETDYRTFLRDHFPSLPDRRAYFVGSPRELAVYTYWGDRMQEDLRHEYTHGLLHASLKEVPLWLDEGLAEYFEVPGATPGKPNSEYVHRLTAELYNGWQPDIVRLEAIEDFARLSYFDYQQCWGWVHFMLHSSDETREILLSYLHDLRTDPAPLPLSHRLEAGVPNLRQAFAAYIGRLHEAQFASTPPQNTRAAIGSSLVSHAARKPTPNSITPVAGEADLRSQFYAFPKAVPESLPALVPVRHTSGEQTVSSGAVVFDHWHDIGREEAKQLFIAGRLTQPTRAGLAAYIQRTRQDEGDFETDSRMAGMIDAAHAIEVLSREHGESALRSALTTP